ncbi:MAG: dihydroneopterin aldolase [Parvularculaceae bacterium]|nr:dihydroneopterin aldolase [Parvularculaceae bacterium]
MDLPLLQPGFYTVFLEEMRSHVKLGVLPHETRPQAVSFSVAAIVSRIGPGDGLEDVVDYNHLRDTIIDLTTDQHYGLQETLCEAIIENLQRHPNVHGVIIETRKLTVYDDAQAVGCRMAAIPAEVRA